MNTWHGHKIYLENGKWRFCDGDELVKNAVARACGYCGKFNTAKGHDGCLEELPGVMNACCGHGVIKEAYIQYKNGNRISGAQALHVIYKKMKLSERKKDDIRIINEQMGLY